MPCSSNARLDRAVHLERRVGSVNWTVGESLQRAWLTEYFDMQPSSEYHFRVGNLVELYDYQVTRMVSDLASGYTPCKRKLNKWWKVEAMPLPGDIINAT